MVDLKKKTKKLMNQFGEVFVKPMKGINLQYLFSMTSL